MAWMKDQALIGLHFSFQKDLFDHSSIRVKPIN